MSDLSDLCSKKGLTMTAKYGEATEYRDDMPNNWRVTLRYQGRRLTTNFYGGSAVTDVDVAGVIYCLCSDARAGAMDFEEFCSDFGYSTDSRAAEKTWKACRSSSTKVRRLLGEDFDLFAEENVNDGQSVEH